MRADQAGRSRTATTLTGQFRTGLTAPIYQTRELSYACNPAGRSVPVFGPAGRIAARAAM
jgi:hypothetical protein